MHLLPVLPSRGWKEEEYLNDRYLNMCILYELPWASFILEFVKVLGLNRQFRQAEYVYFRDLLRSISRGNFDVSILLTLDQLVLSPQLISYFRSGLKHVIGHM